MSKSLLKVLGFLLWTSAVTGVSYALWKKDEFFTPNEETIAKINVIKASAAMRAEGMIRWRDVVQNQNINDGDWVYVPADAKAKLHMESGQIVELGEDTQVQIRSIIRENKQYSYLLNLVRGSVLADLKSDCKDCPSITIKSDESSFNVSAGESLALTKEVGKSAKKLTAKSPLPIYSGKKTASMGYLDSTFSATVQKKAVEISDSKKAEIEPVTPIATPVNKNILAPKIDLKLKSLVAKIEAPVTNKLMYTTDYRSQDIKNGKIIVKLQMPEKKDAISRMMPALQISGTHKKEYVTGISSTSTVPLPVELILSLGTVTTTGLIKDYKVRLLPGLLIEGYKPQAEDFKGIEVELTLRVLGDIQANYVELYMDIQEQNVEFANPWIVNKTIAERNSDVAGILISSQDYRKLRGFIRSSKKIGVYPASTSNKGTYLVRDKKLVGEIISKNNARIEGLVRIAVQNLKVDLIYSGERKSYYEQTLGSNLQENVNKFLDEGKTLYVLKRKRVFSISREFVKENREVASFIDAQARAVFFDNVDIVYSY